MNLLIVCLDALRYDHVTLETMPWLHAKSRTGLLWTDMSVAYPCTIHSVAAMLYGHDHAFAKGPAATTGMPTMAGAVKATHATGAFLGNELLAWKLGRWLFESFDHVVDEYAAIHRNKRMPALFGALEGWTKAQAKQWMAYVHCIEPHEPYLPKRVLPLGAVGADLPQQARLELERGLYRPYMKRERKVKSGQLDLPEDVAQYLRARYRIYCEETDTRLAAFVEPYCRDDTICAVVADHGDYLGEGGMWGHGPANVPGLDVSTKVFACAWGDGVLAEERPKGRTNAALATELPQLLRNGAAPWDPKAVHRELEALGYF